MEQGKSSRIRRFRLRDQDLAMPEHDIDLRRSHSAGLMLEVGDAFLLERHEDFVLAVRLAGKVFVNILAGQRPRFSSIGDEKRDTRTWFLKSRPRLRGTFQGLIKQRPDITSPRLSARIPGLKPCRIVSPLDSRRFGKCLSLRHTPPNKHALPAQKSKKRVRMSVGA